VFHQRHLWTILGVSWKDRVTNVEVLQRAGMPSIESLLVHTQLRWVGHVQRMPDSRIPKFLLYGELGNGVRSRGRPLLRYKDVVKRNVVSAGISNWEELAEDRQKWRAEIRAGAGRVYETWKTLEAARRERRHAATQAREANAAGASSD